MIHDARGKELSLGDLVIYPVRHGSSVTLVEGVLTEVPFDQAGEAKVRRLRVLRRFGGGPVPAKVVSVGLHQLVKIPAE